MRRTPWCLALILAAVVAQNSSEDSVKSAEDVDELPLAEPCDETCRLPECRCSSSSIPSGLTARNTPQFVVLTFDDGVNAANHETYRNTIYNRVNSNGCPIGTTFFITHEYTNYEIVNQLYNHGFEIALNSISHSTPDSLWSEATEEVMRREIADQRIQMSHFANIPYDAIQGVRLPFLRLAGNNSFVVMAESGLLYDATWPTVRFTNPGLWPYTLKHASTQDCVIGPCPSASIPEVWISPIVSWTDLQGTPCSFVDACFHRPNLNDEDGWFQFILTNFERHYYGNRSPFGFYVHEAFLSPNPAVTRALVRFMDLINGLHDVFMVNNADVIDWVKNPVATDVYLQKSCKKVTATHCHSRFCGPYTSEHNEYMSYNLQICNTCPKTYPWVGNPLGL